MGVPCLESDLEHYLPAGGFIRCASDGSDLADVLDAAESDPDWEAQRVSTRDRVVREHSWERRGREIYDDLAGSHEPGAATRVRCVALVGGRCADRPGVNPTPTSGRFDSSPLTGLSPSAATGLRTPGRVGIGQRHDFLRSFDPEGVEGTGRVGACRPGCCGVSTRGGADVTARGPVGASVDCRAWTGGAITAQTGATPYCSRTLSVRRSSAIRVPFVTTSTLTPNGSRALSRAVAPGNAAQAENHLRFLQAAETTIICGRTFRLVERLTRASSWHARMRGGPRVRRDREQGHAAQARRPAM